LSGHDSTHFTGFLLEEEILDSLWDSILINQKILPTDRQNFFFIGKYKGNRATFKTTLKSSRDG
jgi:hypothetical protein